MISCQNNLELHLCCHAYLLVELFYTGMPVKRTDGQSVGRAYGHVITKINLGWVDYQIFLPTLLSFAGWAHVELR